MTEYQKLINKLCECEAVREDIMELRFGTIVKSGRISQLISPDYNEEGKINGRWRMIDDGGNLYIALLRDYIIIGNPLQEKNLRMYFGSKNIMFNIDETGNTLINIRKHNFVSMIIDPTKDFRSQEQSVYTEILNFLESGI